MYAPVVKSANVRKRYQFGDFEAAFLDHIEVEGTIEYEYLFAVFKASTSEPFLIISSERNNIEADSEFFDDLGIDLPEDPGGSHFLCTFDERGHTNMGDSNEWGIAERFEEAAIEIVRRRVGPLERRMSVPGGPTNPGA